MLLEYEFYPDVFFLTVFAMNLLSLFLSGILGGMKGKPAGLLAGAAIGSIWNCLLVLFPVMPSILELTLTIGVIGSLMTSVSFSLKTIAGILRADVLLLISMFLTGGIFTFFRESLWLSDAEAETAVWCLSLGIFYFLKGILKESIRGRERFSVWLYYKGKRKKFLALADSGNRLVEPVTGKPVSVISYESCKGFCDRVSAVLYIPYCAVGTRKGFLTGIIFEKMEIQINGTFLKIEKPIVAVCRERLSTDGDFSMLIPEEFIASGGRS